MAIQKKILLIQLFSNGDNLYATTLARQIKTDFPDCHLTWAIANFCKSIIEHNPFVDEALIVDSVAKNDIVAFRKFRKSMYRQKAEGVYDEVFVTHIMDSNLAYYDGCIRSNVLSAYPYPITVPITPVLRLTDLEVDKTKQFALDNELSEYKNVILFEFAPQSGQSKMTKELAISIAENLVKSGDCAVVMSSGIRIDHNNKAIVDGSVLSIRETAALTHHCTFLLGASSGITWISTSDAARQLPMVQLLNPYTNWVNPISRDFERFGLPIDKVIELLDFTESTIIHCVKLAVADFASAKNKYNHPIPLHFKTTRSIVYNLLCYAQFGAIAKHVQVNKKVYGNNLSFYKEVLAGFIIFPFKLIKNLVTKRM